MTFSVLLCTSFTASEAGVIILPHPDENDVNNEESTEGANLLEPEPEPEIAPLKWPKKPGIPDSDMFDPEDSWFDAPPEGFSLTVSLINRTSIPCSHFDLSFDWFHYF